MIKTIKYFLIGVFFLSALCAPKAQAEIIDKIVVVVNDEIITRGEVDRVLTPIYKQFKSVYEKDELIEKLEEARKNILERLIQDKLLLNEAKKMDLEIEESEIDEKMEEVIGRFASEEEFKKAIAQQNIVVSELRNKYKDRLLIDKVIDIEIRKNISVTPNEVVNYFADHKEDFRETKKIKLRSILIKIDDARSEREAQKLANEILSRLTQGGDFALLAQMYSNGPYADKGGDMGWVKEGDLMEKVNDIVFSLKENQISGIIKTGLGFHIFKAEKLEDEKLLSFPEVKEKIEQFLYKQKINEHLAKWIDELKENAYIAFR